MLENYHMLLISLFDLIEYFEFFFKEIMFEFRQEKIGMLFYSENNVEKRSK